MEDVGEANAAIFEVHQMMLMDLDYVDSIKNIITTQEVNAEYAVATTGDNFSRMFASMDDAYMQGRAADVKDVSDRLLGILYMIPSYLLFLSFIESNRRNPESIRGESVGL